MPKLLVLHITTKKTQSRSRLDYILMSNISLLELKNIEITEPVKSIGVIDHNALKATLHVRVQPKGSGYWKLNNSILNDSDYKKGLLETIDSTKKTYGNLISKQMFWEILKINIREFSMKFSKIKAERATNKLNDFQIDIDDINRKIIDFENKTVLNKGETDTLQLLQIRKAELQSNIKNYLEYKSQGNSIRSRAKWIKEGETGSRYFLGLEKQRQANNVIRKIRLQDNTTVQGNNVLPELVDFYTKLYERKDVAHHKIEEYLSKF